MILYFILPILVAFTYTILYKSQNSTKYHWLFLYFLLFLILFIIAGFRGETVGRDYLNYIDYFNKTLAGDPVTEIGEPTFFLIVKAISLFSRSYVYLFVIYALIGVALKLIAFKKLMGIQEAYLAVIIYLSNFYVLHEMTQIRVGIATSFFLLGLPYIINKNFSKYLLIIIIGSLFHYSLIIALPLYFINTSKINKKLWIGLLAFNLLLYVFNLSFFNMVSVFLPEAISQKVYAYKQFMIENGQNPEIRLFNRFLVYLILNLVLLYCSDILKEKSVYFILLLKISFISLFLAFIFFDFSLLAFRFSELVGVVQICLFAMLGYLFKERLEGVTVVLSISLFLLLVNVVLSGLLQPYYFVTF